MAFDAGMLACILHEISETLGGGKIEKIHMPQKDMIVLIMKNGGGTHRLLVNAGPSSPRMCITSEKSENPATPPMFCMMLRKHLGGAKLIRTEQLGFERAARLTFETYDEMGFKTEKHLIAEIMGKYSNLILTNAEDKIIGLLKSVDFTTSEKRQLLPGMQYELPPKQEKADPLTVTESEFNRMASQAGLDTLAHKFILSSFAGVSSLVAREIAYRAGGVDAVLCDCADTLWREFSFFCDTVRNHTGVPTLVRTAEGAPKEYCFLPVGQYGDSLETVTLPGFSALIDSYFAERSRHDMLSQRASDILRILSAAEARINRKISVQSTELSDCEDGEKFRLYGDLITANIYRLKKGDSSAELENYYEDGATVRVELDTALTPSQNAQKYYKKYAKSKSAKEHLSVQIENSRAELLYIQTVQDALSSAETERELSEIRDELYHSGYASRMKNYTVKKQTAPTVLKFRTTDGRRVLCGKNNTANDYLTTKLAERSDWWFHVKNQAGSHVTLESSGVDDEPTERDFTEAAMIAAHYSKSAGGTMVPVDYTRVRYVKKPAGAKPGFVIYTTNWTAYVTPDAETVERLREK